jgi:SAM-dependent methyltransferase
MLVRRSIRPRGREAFVESQKTGATVLDVGCGGDSPYLTKSQRPDLHYVGIDVSDYNQSAVSKAMADEYLIVRPDKFALTIAGLGRRFDAVISQHNIEHCDDPPAVLAAIASVIKPGGQLYIAWPAEASAHFPSRLGTLNFFDDPTHKMLPRFDDLLGVLVRSGLKPTFQARAYRPTLPAVLGALLEPVSAWTGRVMPYRSTWAWYGFESLIWLQREGLTGC